MKKWIVLAVVVVLALAGWIAAGPFLTINAIQTFMQGLRSARPTA